MVSSRTIAVSLLAATMACIAAPRVTAADTCLRYEPAQVTISGKLVRKIFPGSPGFESVANGDKAETGYYLMLLSAICMSGSDGNFDLPKNDVHIVQLVLDQHGYNLLRPSLGKVVHLRGTLLGEFNGHHHADLLLNFKRVANGG